MSSALRASAGSTDVQAVGHEQALIAAVVGGTQRRVDRALEAPAREQEVAVAGGSKDPVQGTVEESVSGPGRDEVVTPNRPCRGAGGGHGVRRRDDADDDPAYRPDRLRHASKPARLTSVAASAEPTTFVERDQERQRSRRTRP